MNEANRLLMFKSAVTQMEVDPLGIHGIYHWFNVYKNCRILDKNPAPDSDWFYYSFAMLHDCCRVSDFGDIEHPFEAAKLIPVDSGSFNKKLKTAIQNHSTGSVTADPLIGVCWDADRLDLPRVGITPEIKMMSTKYGKELAVAMATPPIYDPIEEKKS